jgi:hypothetical protein
MHFRTTQANPKVSTFSAVELGLMIGAADPMMAFPGGTKFTPYSLLRNTSRLPAVVTPTLWWMQAGSAQSFPLPIIALQPFQTRRLDVSSMLSAAGLKNFNGSFNINLDIQAVAGAVLQAAGSVDQTNTYVFEVNARGIGVSGSRSMPYWSTGNGDDTMVTIWNPADEAQDFLLKLFFIGGQYAFPVHLGARATQTVNVSEIIQNQVPDAEGSIIPTSVHEGSAEITGSLEDSQRILFAADLGIYNVRKAICGAPSCGPCNGFTAAAVAANPFAVPVAGQTQLNLILTWNTGSQSNLTNSSTWSSNNTGVATVQTGLTKGVSPGSATVTAKVTSPQSVYVSQICDPATCPTGEPAPTSPGTVLSLYVDGKNYIFVGNDSNELFGNRFRMYGDAGFTTDPQPTGGTSSASSSDTSDAITQFSQHPPGFQFQTSDQSAARTLTFTYTLNGQSTNVQKNVIARQFAYLTNNSPSNQCTMAHGTIRQYVYTVYTHPDLKPVLSSDNLEGTAVTESFSPSLQCNTVMANGSLDANADITDTVSSLCSNTPLTCTQTSTQTIKVAGYAVRTNTLQWTSNGVNYTNDGPTQ